MFFSSQTLFLLLTQSTNMCTHTHIHTPTPVLFQITVLSFFLSFMCYALSWCLEYIADVNSLQIEIHLDGNTIVILFIDVCYASCNSQATMTGSQQTNSDNDWFTLCADVL